MRDGRVENKFCRASGLNLRVASTIPWNTRYLERALTDMGTPNDIAQHVGPLGW